MQNLMEEMLENPQSQNDEFSNFDIVSLFGKETLEEIQDKVSKATGLAFVTVDYKGEPVTKLTSFTCFCQEMRKNKEAEHLCKSSDAFGSIQAAVTQKTSLYFCPCGLLEVAIPIIIKGYYLGGFIGGQVRCEDAPKEINNLKNIMQPIEKLKNSESMKEFFNQISTISYEKFVYIADLISLIINQLGEKEVSKLTQKKYLNNEVDRLKEKKRRIELENSLKSAELTALKSQMNPHFLFNCLSSISNLAVIEDAPRTNEMTTMFAEFVRYNLNNTQSTISLYEEINNMKRYLNIQKIRFGEQLNFSINISDEMLTQKIPNFILMPFVENAIIHGILPKSNGGTVKISIYYENDDIIICIQDNGLGMSPEKLAQIFKPYKHDYDGSSVGIGITNTRQRLIAYFGEEYDVKIESAEGIGTKSIIRYPKNFDERAI